MGYMTTDELAELIRTPPSTLRYWRHIRKGPPSFKIGKRAIYDSAEVDAWLQEHRAGATDDDPKTVRADSKVA
jgi:hypothetical protein